MAKYKVLKSIAHNTGHSYVSAMNYFDGAFPIEHVRAAARRVKAERIDIDLLTGRIEPPALDSPEVRETVTIARATFRRLLEDSGWTPEQIRSAKLQVGLPMESCRVELIDDRGQCHVGDVRQWGV